MTLRLTTRGIRTAEAIRDRVPFTTSGSLQGEECTGYLYGTGRLNSREHDALSLHQGGVDYVVYSYATPIAWHSGRGWHIVSQRFSPTTTKHQGNLYLTRCTCTTQHGTDRWTDVTGEQDFGCPIHGDGKTLPSSDRVQAIAPRRDDEPNEYGFVCAEFDECGSCIHSDHNQAAGL